MNIISIENYFIIHTRTKIQRALFAPLAGLPKGLRQHRFTIQCLLNTYNSTK